MQQSERQQLASARRALRTRRRVWAYISAHPRASIREISDALGLSSPNGKVNGIVALTIRFLRDSGYINGEPRSKRAHAADPFFYVGPLTITKRKR